MRPVDEQARTGWAGLLEAAEILAPSLDPSARLAVRDAVDRAARGHARVLVLGEAKRGKSTLVNALFDAELLPTGVLPLTSVATVVRVGPGPTAHARALDGTWRALPLGEVADLVSELGNPGNLRGVDHVEITSPTPCLPVGNEVVDTPGTGSVHHLNTAEAHRARAVLDVAVLVVSVDPPISAAELDLLADSDEHAAHVAVVVNKVDLVETADVDEIVEFTARVVGDRIGEVPIFSMAARPTGGPGQRADGLDAFLTWLDTQVTQHGAGDAAASARGLLRRHADDRRDGVRVERELLRRRRADTAVARTALRDVVDRSREGARAAADRITGEAHRLRRELDLEHDRAVSAAVAAASELLAVRLPELDELTPEQLDEAVRGEIIDRTRDEVRTWFGRRHDQLRDRLERSALAVLEDLNRELCRARVAAAELLDLDLAPVDEIEWPSPFPAPSFSGALNPVWQDLLSATVARHLPSSLRRRRVGRRLREWIIEVIPRPYGQARAGLQQELETATRTVRTSLEELWTARMSALDRGLGALQDAHARSDAETDAHLAHLESRERELGRVLSLLEG